MEATDRQIDGLVYEPCGLTDHEMAIVEDRTGSRNTKEVDTHAR